MCNYLGFLAFAKDTKLKQKNCGQNAKTSVFHTDCRFWNFFNKLKLNSRCWKLGSKKSLSCKNTERWDQKFCWNLTIQTPWSEALAPSRSASPLTHARAGSSTGAALAPITRHKLEQAAGNCTGRNASPSTTDHRAAVSGAHLEAGTSQQASSSSPQGWACTWSFRPARGWYLTHLNPEQLQHIASSHRLILTSSPPFPFLQHSRAAPNQSSSSLTQLSSVWASRTYSSIQTQPKSDQHNWFLPLMYGFNHHHQHSGLLKAEFRAMFGDHWFPPCLFTSHRSTGRHMKSHCPVLPHQLHCRNTPDGLSLKSKNSGKCFEFDKRKNIHQRTSLGVQSELANLVTEIWLDLSATTKQSTV